MLWVPSSRAVISRDDLSKPYWNCGRTILPFLYHMCLILFIMYPNEGSTSNTGSGWLASFLIFLFADMKIIFLHQFLFCHFADVTFVKFGLASCVRNIHLFNTNGGRSPSFGILKLVECLSVSWLKKSSVNGCQLDTAHFRKDLWLEFLWSADMITKYLEKLEVFHECYVKCSCNVSAFFLEPRHILCMFAK